MSTPFCGYALEWWLKNQDKFNNVTVTTRETNPGSGEFEITEWVVPGVDKPTDEQVVQIIADYEEAMSQKASRDAANEANAISKLKALGLTDAEINALRSR